jgi:uncharacterized Zn-finger protein
MVRTDGPSVPRVSVWKSVPFPASIAEITEPRSMSTQLEDQRDSTSPLKQRAARKKPVVSAIWPCKINGCNKHFAREADLKRHQRTTKLHSMPG